MSTRSKGIRKPRSVLRKQSVRKKREKRTSRTFLKAVSLVGSASVRVFVVFALIVVISFSFLALYRYIVTSPYMRLEEVVLKGADQKMKREIVQAGSLNSGLSLFALNLHEIKQKIEKNPWIRSIKMERRFPHTLIIHVEKQLPVALVNMDGLYYVNRWGEVFKDVKKTESMNFPIISGLAKDDAVKDKQLEKAAIIVRALEKEKKPWSLGELSEIHVSEYGAVSLYYNHISAEIKLPCDDFVDKMTGLRKVGNHLSQTGQIHKVKRIDLNYADGAVVSMRNG